MTPENEAAVDRATADAIRAYQDASARHTRAKKILKSYKGVVQLAGRQHGSWRAEG